MLRIYINIKTKTYFVILECGLRREKIRFGLAILPKLSQEKFY